MEIERIVNKICEQVTPEEVNKAKKHMEEYLKILDILRKNGVEDPEFRRKFSYFYRLRRDDKFKDEYFKIIANKECNLQQILTKLHDLSENGNIEFVFATKAIHTINNNEPIWDQYVNRALGDEFEIECKAAIYEKLREMQKQLLKDARVLEKINKIRDSLEPEQRNVSNEKILDFLLWEAGKPVKNKEGV